MLTILLASVVPGCGRKKAAHRLRHQDAATATPRGTQPTPSGPPRTLSTLLVLVPRRATWLVAVGRPGDLATRAARLWKLLAQIPDLTDPMARLAGQISRTIGGWPPPRSSWRAAGLDPAGALLVAGISSGPGRPAGMIALAHAREPQVVLRRLASRSPKGSSSARATPMAGSAPAPLLGWGDWRCSPVPGPGPLPAPGPGPVACASSRELLEELKALSGRAPGAAGATVLPTRDLEKADLVAAWRPFSRAPWSWASVRMGPVGLLARARLRWPGADRWLGWLGPAGSSPAPTGAQAAYVRLRLDRAHLGGLLGMLPKGSLLPRVQGAASPERLLGQCTGALLLEAASWGWRLRAARAGPELGLGKPMRWSLSGWPIWVRAPVGELLVAGSETALAGAARRGPLPLAPTPDPLGKLLAQPASATLRLHLLDPLELLTEADRARVLAAMVGLPPGERALVSLARGLLTLLGEVVLSVVREPGGARLTLASRSLLQSGPATRGELDRLWQAKWQGGGLLDRQELRRVAALHPRWPVANLARSLKELHLSPRWSRAMADRLLELLKSLAGAEVSCAALSARLSRCVEPFSRVREPRRWRMAQVGTGTFEGGLRKDLLEAARREIRALGERCDRLGGRLENASALARCLEAESCLKLSDCVVRAFTPAPPAPGGSGAGHR